MVSPIEYEFLSLKHVMEYIIHHPHQPIMYSRKKIIKLNYIPHQRIFKSDSA